MNYQYNLQAQLSYTLGIIIFTAISIFIVSKVSNIF